MYQKSPDFCWRPPTIWGFRLTAGGLQCKSGVSDEIAMEVSFSTPINDLTENCLEASQATPRRTEG